MFGAEWNLSTRDKLGTGPFVSGTSLQGTSWGWVIVPYTMEPLYKGQVGDESFVPYTVEPLYKGRVGGYSLPSWVLSLPCLPGYSLPPWVLPASLGTPCLPASLGTPCLPGYSLPPHTYIHTHMHSAVTFNVCNTATVLVLIEAPQKNNSTRGGNVQNKNEFICVHMARCPEWRLN